MAPKTSSLSRSDRLLLWAIRTWVIGLKQRTDATLPLDAAFAKYDVRDGACLIDALMSIVACGATRTLTVECVCCGELSGDESRLLNAAALYQSDRGLEAQFVLREFLAPTASRHAGQVLRQLSANMLDAAHKLSPWSFETERLAFANESGKHATLH